VVLETEVEVGERVGVVGLRMEAVVAVAAVAL
jgi:hypothetical protein